MALLPNVTRRKLPERDISQVFDNGRRGLPLSGCDCVACFGMCMINPDIRYREGLRRADERGRAADDEGASIV
jgi:hypothetical protein